MSEVILYQYLLPEEANEVTRGLRSVGVNSIKKRARGRGTMSFEYYQIIISETDIEKSKPIIEKFNRWVKDRQERTKSTCPKCGAKNNFSNVKMNVLKRLLYIGTKLVRCNKCKEEWII